jgi:hypothetical protein
LLWASAVQRFDIVTETLVMSVPVGEIVTDWRPPRAAMPMRAVKPMPLTCAEICVGVIEPTMRPSAPRDVSDQLPEIELPAAWTFETTLNL